MGSLISTMFDEFASSSQRNKDKRESSLITPLHNNGEFMIGFGRLGNKTTLNKCIYCTRDLETGVAHSMDECVQYMKELSKLFYDKHGQWIDHEKLAKNRQKQEDMIFYASEMHEDLLQPDIVAL